MGKKYQVYEDDAAVLMAMSALLNAEIAGMKALNHERKVNGMSLAYPETDFYTVSRPLNDFLKSLEREPPQEQNDESKSICEIQGYCTCIMGNCLKALENGDG